MAGAVSLNDVQGGATASVTHTTLSTTGGSVLVQAKEMATLTATTTSEVTASSESAPLTTPGSTTKSPLALSGLIGTNLVQSAARATLGGSHVTTTGTGTGVGGVTVDAENTATLTAMTTNAATASTSSGDVGGGGSGSAAVGVTLAFNTIGWQSQNVLFNAIDALLGSPTIANAFGEENPSNATATMLDTTVNASGQLTVSALDGPTISSTISNTTTASASEGGPVGEKGSQDLALGFVLATNKVSGSAQASIDFDTGNLSASTIQAGEGVSVTAQDSSGISATITLGSSSAGTGEGSTGMAGAVSLNDVRGGATASVTHTTLSTTGGNVLVQAKEMATLTATTISEVTAGSEAAPLTTPGSTTKSPLALNGLIGTNLVQSAASATLSKSNVTTTGTGVGGVTVDAENTATLTAMTTNAATASSSTGDVGGGGSGDTAVGVTLAFNTIGWESQNVLFNAIDALLGSPTIANAFGAENPSNATATMLDTTVNASGKLTVSALDGPTIASTISNTTEASSSEGGVGSFTGEKGGQDLAVGFVLATNKVSGSAQASIDFDTGNLPASTIQAGGGVSVTAQDSSGITATITLGASSEGTGEGSTGVAGAVSLNDVQGGATASVTHTTLSTTGGSVLVQAKEMATLTATTTSELTASSESAPLTTPGSTTKSPLALNGLIGTNLVQSAASATLGSSHVTTTGTGTGVGGVTVDSENTAKLTAMTTNAATASSSTGDVGGGGSGNTAVGVTLAFNTIGWQSQNVLFNAIDALLGSPTIANAFGAENPSNATATMLDTTVNASGQLIVSALDDATITSTISNTSTASSSEGGVGSVIGEKGGQDLAVGFVLATNKVSGSAQASIDFDTGNLPASTIQAGGGVSVTAQDSSGITATITLGASSEGTGEGSTGVAGAVSLNDVRGGATASLTHTTLSTTGGNVLVQAKEMATLAATTNSEVSAGSSSTPKTTAGSTTTSPLAISGLIGTNLVQSSATATLGSSNVTTTGTGAAVGGVTVDAENTAKLTAMTTNAATTTSSSGSGGSSSGGSSGTTAVGVTLAFNTIGWKSQNVLFNAIDALLGSPTLASAFGGENPSDATATMLDTIVNASGQLTVSALTDETITSSITNTSKASSSGLMGASGTAVAVVLSMNKVSSAAQASITFDTSFTPPATGAEIQSAGGVAVNAQDTSTIGSTLTLNAKVTSSGVGGGQQTTKAIAVAGAVAYNDVNGGASASLTHATINATGSSGVAVTAQEAANLTATLSVVADASGQTFGGGSTSSLAVGGIISTNVVRSAATALLGSSIVTTSSGNVHVEADNTPTITATLTNEVKASSSSSTGLAITLAFNSIGWQAQNVLFNTVDALLGDPLISMALGGQIPSGATASLVDTKVTAGGAVSVIATNAGKISAPIINTTDAMALGLPTSSGSQPPTGFGLGIVISMNRISGAADAVIDYDSSFTPTGTSDISAGAGGVSVTASDTEQVTSTITLTVQNFSVSLTQQPRATAVSGLVALNDVRGGATADIVGGRVSVTGGNLAITAAEGATITATLTSKAEAIAASFQGGSSLAVNGIIDTNLILGGADAYAKNSSLTTTTSGNIDVTATNTMSVQANIDNTTISNGTSVGVTLAFNTIGIKSQNFLFNTLDALFGTNLGGEQPADVLASLENTSAHAAGAVNIMATSNANINAVVKNNATAINLSASSQNKTNAISVGAVVALNKISTHVEASVNGSTLVQAGNGSVAAQAQDTSTITSQIQATSLAVGGGTSQTTAVSVGLSASRNDIDDNMQAYLQNVNQVTATNGNVHVSSHEAATINATSRATAIQVAASTQSSRAIGGGGATALNSITGQGNAFIMDSPSIATGTAANTGAIILSADTAAKITAVVQAISVGVALSAGSNATPAISIGFSLAQNLIGSSGAGNSVGVEAYTEGSSLTADQGISLSAASTAMINATVDATSVAVAASTSSTTVGVTAAGVSTDNEIYLTVHAGIDGGTGVLAKNGNISVTATDTSTIISNAQAVSVTADLSGGGTSAGISVGLSLAMNTIDNDVQAYITNAGSATASAGAISLSTTENSTITDTSTAASIAVGASAGTTGLALSGGGAVATNVILGGAQAYVQNTNLDSFGTTGLSAVDTSSITAQVLAVSGSLSFGTSTGVAASIGAAVAMNLIGYDTSGNTTPFAIKAYVLNSSVSAGGAYTIKANSNETIKATTAAGSVAVAATSGGTSVGVSGSGVFVENKIADTVLAYHDGGTTTAGINAPSVSISASDTSTITATAAAVSLAASFGNNSVAVSIGVSLATNQIDNDVEAFIANAVTPVAPATAGVTTTVGGISVMSTESAHITATSAAASLAVGVSTSAFGGAISGAGAAATNVILGKDNAYVSASNLNSKTTVGLDAEDQSQITAQIISVAASFGLGSSAAVGASIGASVAQNSIGNTAPLQVEAYVLNSGISAPGAYTATANSHQSINALVLALTASVSASSGISIAASGSGASAVNQIAVNPQAYQNGDGSGTGAGVNVASVTFNAMDTSAITATVAAVALAVPVGGNGAVGVAIGVSLANNTINNDVESFIANAAHGVTTTSGGISLTSTESAHITATSAAASLAVGVSTSAFGGAISGAGAAATNVILGKDNAYVSASNLNSKTTVALDAEDQSKITAQIISVAASLGVGSGAGVGASIGASVAQNFIGYAAGGSMSPLQVEAYVLNSGISAPGAYTLTANSHQTINALVLALTASISASGGGAIGASGSGASAVNQISVAPQAFQNGDGSGTGAGVNVASVTFKAMDTSTINANVASVALAGSVGGAAAVGVAIGVSLANNTINNDVESYIASAAHGVTTTSGGISLTSTESAQITATSAAASLAVGVGVSAFGAALSGAGAAATNVILGKDNAYVSASNLNSKTTVALDAEDQSQITAQIISVAASLGVSSGVAVGASIGASVAQNSIGGNTAPLQVEAYVLNSGISAPGAYTLTANSHQTINALVLALTASVAASGGVGVAASGSGASAVNQIAVDPQAFQNGDGSGTGAGVNVASLTFKAMDTSTINANVASVALAGSVGGVAAVTVSIGVSLANNTINNDVETYIASAAHGVTTTIGGISLTSTESAQITATSAAAALAVGVGVSAFGGAISGAGAAATNVILGKDNAYVSASNLTSKTTVGLDAEDQSQITAQIISVAASIGVGTGAAVGASIGASVAQNFIGYATATTMSPLQVEAYVLNSGISAPGAYTLTANSHQTINALVLALTASIAASGGWQSAAQRLPGASSCEPDCGRPPGLPERRRLRHWRRGQRRQRHLQGNGHIDHQRQRGLGRAGRLRGRASRQVTVMAAASIGVSLANKHDQQRRGNVHPRGAGPWRDDHHPTAGSR